MSMGEGVKLSPPSAGRAEVSSHVFDSASISSHNEDSESSSSCYMVEDEEEEQEEDASSSSSSNGSSHYDLSDLMTHLPIKRGLSMYYEGKSQSFTSLASVRSVEDLAKRVCSSRRKNLKAWRSCGGELDGQRLHSPRGVIAKKYSSSWVSTKKAPSHGFGLGLAPERKLHF